MTNYHDLDRHIRCPMCGGEPPIFVREYERQVDGDLFRQYVTVKIYRCPKCEKLWEARVKTESEKH